MENLIHVFINFNLENDLSQLQIENPTLGNNLYAWASAEIFPGGATSTFRLSFFRLRTMQCKWTFTKRFTLTTPQRKFPIFLQLLLNWGIIQYHYYCELQIIESELDLNYPQLRLRCLHLSVRVEPHFSKFSLKYFLYFGYQKCFSFS